MAENKYPINSEWKDYYKVLEDIRRSGICNMWGAADQLNQLTGCGSKRAKEILLSWIENYDELKNLYWPDETDANNEEE